MAKDLLPGERPYAAPLKKSKKAKKKPKKFSLLKLFAYIFIWGATLIFLILLWYSYDLPDIQHLKSSTRKPSIVIQTADGQLLTTYGDLFGESISLRELPPHVPQAILSIEDKRFFNHFGIDPIGLIRAFYSNYKAGHSVQGGSTITQQVVKNVFLSAERTMRRKIQEAILAFWLEKRFSKEEILSIYLNRIYFGAGAYGINAAALKYFNKKASQLSIKEASILAALIKAPSHYSPFHNPKAVKERSSMVLAHMVDAGFITKNQAKDALRDYVSISNQPHGTENYRYFSDWILENLPEVVSVDDKDLIIKTTLDPSLQLEASSIIQAFLLNQGTSDGVHQMALVCINKNGAIKAMVGGANYSQSQFNRTLALRAGGSAFKLFIYLAALEQGMNSETKISDAPIRVGKWNPSAYKWKQKGDITLKDAFANSVNTSAVRLAHQLSRDSIVNMARRLGISTRQPHDLTVALGSGEVTLLEMSSAYAIVANDGNKVIPFGILEVKTRSGEVLYKYKDHENGKSLSTEVCQEMKKLMSAVIDYGTGKRAKLPVPAIGKTGTSNDSRDVWFFGSARDLTTGVWAGNDDRAPMKSNITGGTITAEVWREFMLVGLGFKSPSLKIEHKAFEGDVPLDEGIGDLIEEMEEKKETIDDLLNNLSG